MYMCRCVCMYVCIYGDIGLAYRRLRGSVLPATTSDNLDMYVCVCVYIYIYTCVCVCMYICFTQLSI